MTDDDIENLFDEGDPLDHPLWQQAEMMADAPPRPTKDYVTCPLVWLSRILPVVCTPNQLVVALLLYRQCLMRRCRTVALSNSDLGDLGISRYAKYRALAHLKRGGVVTVRAKNGQSILVTLHWFP